ncbi:MAG: dephospho-CoA kinase [Alphaproteobacteria bacterium]|nr:dephospho-CoA kinase [Alphaproteobacteria bacterium]
MLIVGLTGGIGMGKSAAAKILRRFGFPIYSADKAVHDVLKKGGAAVKPLAQVFPETVRRGAIDRKALSRAVFGQPEKLRRLEKIVHPLLRKSEQAFLQKARKDKARAAILEIPLLFETGAEKRCAITLCVTAPRATQCARVLSRKGMTPEKLKAILARQLPDAEKRRKADYVVPTGTSLEETELCLRRIFEKLDLLP